MDTTTINFTVKKIALEDAELRVSFWPADDGSSLHSVITMATHGAHFQTPVTAQQLRNLSNLLHQQANELEAATMRHHVAAAFARTDARMA